MEASRDGQCISFQWLLQEITTHRVGLQQKCILTVQEARSLKSRGRQGHISEGSRGESFLPLPALGVLGHKGAPLQSLLLPSRGLLLFLSLLYVFLEGHLSLALEPTWIIWDDVIHISLTSLQLQRPFPQIWQDSDVWGGGHVFWGPPFNP